MILFSSVTTEKIWKIVWSCLGYAEQHFAVDIFKCIFFNENVWISIKISLKFVPKGPINNIPALVQIMAWHRPVDKPLSEPMMVRSMMHICVTRPQWDIYDISQNLFKETYCQKISGKTMRNVFFFFFFFLTSLLILLLWVWPCLHTHCWGKHLLLNC